MKTFSIILLVAIVATTIIEVLEHFFGPANVFLGALAFLPVCFVWMIIQDKHMEKKRKQELTNQYKRS